MSSTILNLDKLAAERAQKIVSRAKQSITSAKTLEHLSTKALGVLQEQGVYAMMIFLFSRSGDEKKIAPLVCTELHEAIKQLPGFNSIKIEDKPEQALKLYTEHVLNDLNTLLLVRDLYEQMLIYVRYGTKATGGV